MLTLSFIVISFGLSQSKSFLEEDYYDFQPSIPMASINASTFAQSDLPMHPLLRPEERRSITFDDDFADIGVGNLDYTGSYEDDLRQVRTLLADLAAEPLYYDTVPADLQAQQTGGQFVPVLAQPAPAPAPQVEVVVKGLPGAGPRLRPGLWRPPPPPPTVCDDKCITVVPGFPGCLEDPEYPTTSLQFALYQDALKSRKLPAEPDDALEYPGDAEINYIHGYTSAFSPQHWDNYQGFLCPSKVEFVRPMRLRNTEGKWRVILNNVGPHSQTVRVETCLTAGGECRLMPPCYRSHCTQLHTFHRLLSYNPCSPGDGLTTDTFRLPSGCSCAIQA